MIKFPLQKHKIGCAKKFLSEKLTTKWLNVNSPEFHSGYGKDRFCNPVKGLNWFISEI